MSSKNPPTSKETAQKESIHHSLHPKRKTNTTRCYFNLLQEVFLQWQPLQEVLLLKHLLEKYFFQLSPEDHPIEVQHGHIQTNDFDFKMALSNNESSNLKNPQFSSEIVVMQAWVLFQTCLLSSPSTSYLFFSREHCHCPLFMLLWIMTAARKIESTILKDEFFF